MRAILWVLAVAALGLAIYVFATGVRLQDIAAGTFPGLPQAAPETTVLEPGAEAPKAAVAKLDAKATMIAGRRIEIAAQWTSDSGPAYLESVTAYYLKDTGEVVREIPFEVREIRTGFDFTRRFPLEPEAQFFGVCAVYASAKAAPRVRASALFVNKGEGAESPMLTAVAPGTDNTGGCFPGAPS
jgi:hypothetical protein